MGEQRVEVGVEVGKGPHRREGIGDTLMPPSALEAAQLVMVQAQAEGQARSGTERTAKTGADGIFGGVETEIAREAGVGTSDGLARLEQSAGGVEEGGGDHQKKRCGLIFSPAAKVLALALRRAACGAPTRKCRRACRMRRRRFWAAQSRSRRRARRFCFRLREA